MLGPSPALITGSSIMLAIAEMKQIILPAPADAPFSLNLSSWPTAKAAHYFDRLSTDYQVNHTFQNI